MTRARIPPPRRSARRFLGAPVDRAEVEDILAVANRAPSGTNMQPWKATALAGAAKRELEEAILAAFDSGEKGHESEVPYYPAEFPEPYRSRRRAVGWALYGLLGIAKGEKEKMRAQQRRNYLFFDAPVGLIFTIDRVLGRKLDRLRHVPPERHGGGARAGWTPARKCRSRATIA